MIKLLTCAGEEINLHSMAVVAGGCWEPPFPRGGDTENEVTVCYICLANMKVFTFIANEIYLKYMYSGGHLLNTQIRQFSK